MKEMAKYLTLWRINAMALPTDPVESLQSFEMMSAATENLIQTGGIDEMGYFLDGKSGYTISGGEAKDAFTRSFSFFPFFEFKVHEVVPRDPADGIMRGVLKSRAEAMKR
jgi:hypothetical protein